MEVVEHRIEVRADPRPRTVEDWSGLLTELTGRLDSGRIYDRDLPALNGAVIGLVQAFNRRIRA